MSSQGTGNPFRRVFRGDRIEIQAATWNALMSVGEREAARVGSGGVGGPMGSEDFGSATDWVWILNSSGGDLDQFSVVGIDSVAITKADNLLEFQKRVVLSGITPTVAAHTGKFAVLAEPIGSGKLGRAYVGGVFPVQINIVSTSDKWADVKDSDATQLQSAGMGSAQILWSEGTTGTKWAVVRIGAQTGGMISGKVTSNASGNAKYNGKSFTPPTGDVSASGNLAEADFGTLSSTEDCLILNPPELGVSNTGHDVMASTNTNQFAIYFTGRLASVNSTGIKVVHAMLFWAGCT